MSAALNFFWAITGGFASALSWFFTGAICYMTIIGIPFGKACFTIGKFSFAPFGKEAISRSLLTGKEDVGTSTWGKIGNVVWFLCCGWPLALVQSFVGIGACATIVGIPLGIQCFKLAGVALSPIGKEIVPKEVAAEARKRHAMKVVNDYQSNAA